jgi:hypothetical protein
MQTWIWLVLGITSGIILLGALAILMAIGVSRSSS